MSAMSDAGADLAPIACETCRRKKCKCDRKLPSCSQCRSSPEGCLYPDQERRGMPAGYVNNLQKRLAETERALFFALRELHDGTTVLGDYDSRLPDQPTRKLVASSDVPTTRQQKATQESSWHNTPLGNRAQAKAWLESIRTEAHADAGDHAREPAEMLSGAAGTPTEASDDAATVSNQPDGDQGVQRASTLQGGGPKQPNSTKSLRRKDKPTVKGADGSLPWAASSAHEDLATQRPSSDPSEPSKASIFARANKDIYF